MRKQPAYTILLVLTIVSTSAAILTLLPESAASKECILGYKAHCTFAPFSTLMCLVLSSIVCRVRAKKFKSK